MWGDFFALVIPHFNLLVHSPADGVIDLGLREIKCGLAVR